MAPRRTRPSGPMQARRPVLGVEADEPGHQVEVVGLLHVARHEDDVAGIQRHLVEVGVVVLDVERRVERAHHVGDHHVAHAHAANGVEDLGHQRQALRGGGGERQHAVARRAHQRAGGAVLGLRRHRFGGQFAVGDHLRHVFDNGGLRRDRVGRHHRGELVQHLRRGAGDGAVALLALHGLAGGRVVRRDAAERGARRQAGGLAQHLLARLTQGVHVGAHLVAGAELVGERGFHHLGEGLGVHRLGAQQAQHAADQGVVGRHALAAHQAVGVQGAQVIGLVELGRLAEGLRLHLGVDDDGDVARVVRRVFAQQRAQQREQLGIEQQHHVGDDERRVVEDRFAADHAEALHRGALLRGIEEREGAAVVAGGDEGGDQVLRGRDHARAGRAEQEHLQLARFDAADEVLAGEGRMRLVEARQRALRIEALLAQGEQRFDRVVAGLERRVDQAGEEVAPGRIDGAGLRLVEIADARAAEGETDAPARGHLHGAGEGHQALVAAGEHLRIAAELDGVRHCKSLRSE
jgi:hypothetical protein